MARDPRKGAAYASGMRGREKPKVAEAHGRTMGQEDSHAGADGNSKQGPGKVIGNPDGVSPNDSAYSSGMRGLETGKQKPAARAGGTAGTATFGQARGSKSGGESHQEANTMIGNPDGTDTARMEAPSGVSDAHIRGTAEEAYKLGIPGNNTEQAAQGGDPIGAEEDDTHINIRVPKSSITKRKGARQSA